MLARHLPLTASEVSYVLLAAFPVPTEDIRYLVSLVLQSTYHYLVGDRSKYFKSYCRRPQPEEMWIWDQDLYNIAGPSQLVCQLAAHRGVDVRGDRFPKLKNSVGGLVEAMYHDIVFELADWLLERSPDRELVTSAISKTLQRALHNLEWAATPALQYEVAMTARALGIKHNTNSSLWEHNEGREDFVAPYRPDVMRKVRDRVNRAKRAWMMEKARKRLEKYLDNGWNGQ
ncbi:hypothetical protein FRC07_008686 [Ceratobasidium sp. 392]|nr:hypothetical protein FRC07_008686 [Ceratobasidium sp. 392]